VGVLPSDLSLLRVSVEVPPCLGALAFPGVLDDPSPASLALAFAFFQFPSRESRQCLLRQTDSTYSGE
jgi:hypothetical protein